MTEYPARKMKIASLGSGATAFLVMLVTIVSAYHHGGTDTNCWQTTDYGLQPSCDEIAEVTFIQSPSVNETLYVNEPFSVIAVLAPAQQLLPKDGFLVPHANFHMCRADVGWCTPDVKVTPNLATQSPEVKSNSTSLQASELLVAFPGDWSIVAHFTILTPTGGWEVAAGFKRRFFQRSTELEVGVWAVTLIYTLSALGIAMALAIGAFVFYGRNHWVMRASSPRLSIVVVLGCLLAFVTVYTLSPPQFAAGSTYNDKCNSRIWLLSFSFDFVLVPLALKTWRVSVLFNRKSSFKRVNITDVVLTRLAIIVIVIDATYCLIWNAGFPLHAGQVPTVSNPEAFYTVQCIGDKQLVFEVITMIFHGLPLIWLAVIGRRVRSSFRRRSIDSTQSSGRGPRAHITASSTSEKKMSQFNESESLALALSMIACVSIFAVALQYTVTDSPTAQMLMVAGGMIWSSFFILVVMFFPRIADYMRYEKDGITKRKSGDLIQPGVLAVGVLLRRAGSNDTRSQSQLFTPGKQRQSTTADMLTTPGSVRHTPPLSSTCSKTDPSVTKRTSPAIAGMHANERLVVASALLAEHVAMRMVLTDSSNGGIPDAVIVHDGAHRDVVQDFDLDLL